MRKPTSTRLSKLGRFLEDLVGPFVPHMPTPHQAYAMTLSGVDEVLYGGAAGGGKTDWLLMEALRFADVKDYSAIIFRRTFPELSAADGLIERSKEWLTGIGKYNEAKNYWTLPARGGTSRLQFAHMQHDKHKYQHQSAAYQFVGFDELTSFLEPMYRYLFSRARRPNAPSRELSNVPIRVRVASNPGNVGMRWVSGRFPVLLDDDQRNRLMLVETTDDLTGEKITYTRAFIPALLSDNPFMDAAAYRRKLSQLHPHERAQLLKGDWKAKDPDGRFDRGWFEVVEPNSVPSIVKDLRAWDFAATLPSAQNPDPDFCAASRMGLGSDGNVYVLNLQHFRASPAGVEERFKSVCRADGTATPVWVEQEPGSSGKLAVSNLQRSKDLRAFAIRGQTSTGDKISRADPFCAAAERGEIKIVRGTWNDVMFDELEDFKEDCVHDDIVDSLSLGYSKLVGVGGWVQYNRSKAPQEEVRVL